MNSEGFHFLTLNASGTCLQATKTSLCLGLKVLTPTFRTVQLFLFSSLFCLFCLSTVSFFSCPDNVFLNIFEIFGFTVIVCN